MTDTPKSPSQLKPVEAVRCRPAMYIGSKGRGGLYHMLSAVIENAVEEAMSGYCDEIIVTLHDGKTVTVEDNGRGIPVWQGVPICDAPDATRSFLEQVLTAHPSDGGAEYSASRGPGCAALFVVNGCSESFTVDVHRDGLHHRMQFARGVALRDLEVVGPSERHGTAITFTPDLEIFGEHFYFLPELIYEYLLQLASLNPEVTIRFKDGASGSECNFHFPGGIRKLVELSNSRPGWLWNDVWESSIVYGKTERNGDKLEIALLHAPGAKGVRTFVNSVELYGIETGIEARDDWYRCRWYTKEKIAVGRTSKPGGSESEQVMCVEHTYDSPGPQIDGFLDGILHVRGEYAQIMGLDMSSLRRARIDDILCGVSAVISLRLRGPKIGGSTRMRLAPSFETWKVVRDLTIDLMTQVRDRFPQSMESTIGKMLESD